MIHILDAKLAVKNLQDQIFPLGSFFCFWSNKPEDKPKILKAVQTLFDDVTSKFNLATYFFFFFMKKEGILTVPGV